MARLWLTNLVALSTVAALALAAPHAAEAAPRSDACAQRPASPLAPEHRQFLDEAALLLSDQERALFLCLVEGYQRDSFVVQFWKARDPYPDTARNEFREQWQERLVSVRQTFDDLEEPRARYWLLQGPPTMREVVCPARSSDAIEAWFYGFDDMAEVYTAVASRRVRRDQLAIVFYRRYGIGPWRIWLPGESFETGAATSAAAQGLGAGCQRDVLEAALTLIQMRNAEGGALGFLYERMIAERLEPPEPPSNEWVLTFESYRTDPPPDAPRLEAAVDVSYPGRHQARTVVQVLASVDPESATIAELLGRRVFAFETIGEILRGDEPELFESFRYRFELPATAAATGRLSLVVQRYLRPGRYRLVLRIDDLNAGAVHRSELELEVPGLDATASGSTAEPPAPDVEAAFAEANRRLRDGEPTLRIVVPSKDLLSGYQRFETLTTGPVDDVVFYLDEREIFRRHRPPWSVDLDLGRLPRSQVLRAVALDSSDQPIASDSLLVNASPFRFAVHIVDPAPGSRHQGSVRVRVETTVPEKRAVERVELYRGDELVAALFQPPYVQPIALPAAPQLTVLRAVGVLTSGDTTEHTVIVNGPASLEQVRVDLVELYTTVTDRQGRTQLDLAESDFRVLEDGVPQVVTRFERVDDTPIRGTILLDVSASMTERLASAVQAAARFFQEVVRPGDELSVVTFNDRPQLVAPFTGDLQELGSGLLGLRAERGTALYDSLIYTLYQLNGLGGQRVVLLLSDGKDEHSRFAFDDVLEYARRSEAAIYAIGIALPRKGPDDPRQVLAALASETGGSSFFLDDLTGLDEVYRAIARELRSKYLIAYQSSNNEESTDFRSVSVELVDRPGEARTLRGYYP
jgi:Ca-activated chloride channel homolog